MERGTETLPNDVDELKSIVETLTEELNQKNLQLETLEEENRRLKGERFDRRSEKLSDEELKQLQLFNEAEAAVCETTETEAVTETVEVKAHARRKTCGRKPFPENLPHEIIVVDIPEAEKTCGCGAKLVEIGRDVCEKAEYVPAKLIVKRYERPRYACKACEGTETTESAVKIAPPAPTLLPKAMIEPGLLAYIIASKFCDALPFFRMEKIFARYGIDIGRADMGNWAIEAAKRCGPLIQLFEKELLSFPAVLMDETPVQVMKEPGRKDTTKSYMWVAFGGPPEARIVFYQYHRTRSSEVPVRFLDGYSGFLQSDGYIGYDRVGAQPGIVHAGCWAHVRRKFFEAKKASKNSGDALAAMDFILQLYLIEDKYRPLWEKQELDNEAFIRKRKNDVGPMFAGLREWLDQRRGRVLPSSPLGKAIDYAVNRWEKLVRYVDCAYLTPDTNRVENAIRPFTIGRKNWMFSGCPEGAFASAALYTLVETAKANQIEPYAYLKFVFETIPLLSKESDWRILLPAAFKAKSSK
jgi:transposase